MRRPTFLFALTALIIAWMQSVALAESNTWRTYANPRFGTTADYPAFLFINREPPPENGDGQAFTNKDETAKLSVYGSFNIENYTPQSYMKELIRPHDAITYERVAKNFFVASGPRGENIWYQRCNFQGGDPGIVHCFVLEYPAKQKEFWNPIVSRISQSLRVGSDWSSHGNSGDAE